MPLPSRLNIVVDENESRYPKDSKIKEDALHVEYHNSKFLHQFYKKLFSAEPPYSKNQKHAAEKIPTCY
jgi:hypothetical protein